MKWLYIVSDLIRIKVNPELSYRDVAYLKGEGYGY